MTSRLIANVISSAHYDGEAFRASAGAGALRRIWHWGRTLTRGRRPRRRGTQRSIASSEVQDRATVAAMLRRAGAARPRPTRDYALAVDVWTRARTLVLDDSAWAEVGSRPLLHVDWVPCGASLRPAVVVLPGSRIDLMTSKHFKTLVGSAVLGLTARGHAELDCLEIVPAVLVELYCDRAAQLRESGTWVRLDRSKEEAFARLVCCDGCHGNPETLPCLRPAEDKTSPHGGGGGIVLEVRSVSADIHGPGEGGGDRLWSSTIIGHTGSVESLLEVLRVHVSIEVLFAGKLVLSMSSLLGEARQPEPELAMDVEEMKREKEEVPLEPAMRVALVDLGGGNAAPASTARRECDLKLEARVRRNHWTKSVASVQGGIEGRQLREVTTLLATKAPVELSRAPIRLQEPRDIGRSSQPVRLVYDPALSANLHRDLPPLESTNKYKARVRHWKKRHSAELVSRAVLSAAPSGGAAAMEVEGEPPAQHSRWRQGLAPMPERSAAMKDFASRERGIVLRIGKL